MPAVTPNFNIIYPCASDTIDVTIFGQWAQDIEDAILAVQARGELARIRPRAQAFGSTNLPAGVPTPLNLTTDIITHADIVNGGTFFTVTRAGVYMATCQIYEPGPAIVSLSITGPGTQVLSRDLPSSAVYLNTSGLLVMAAGNTATPSATSTTLLNNVQGLFSLAFICEV